MSGSLNKVMLIGNLGKDAEIHYTGGGTAVANVTLATSERWTDKAGQKQERTEWHTVVIWDSMAETLGQYLVKGKQVYVEGRLQTRSWEDKKTGGKRYATEIRADKIVLLGGGKVQREPGDDE
jgi:single-strand DNA-binding protein